MKSAHLYLARFYPNFKIKHRDQYYFPYALRKTSVRVSEFGILFLIQSTAQFFSNFFHIFEGLYTKSDTLKEHFVFCLCPSSIMIFFHIEMQQNLITIAYILDVHKWNINIQVTINPTLINYLLSTRCYQNVTCFLYILEIYFMSKSPQSRRQENQQVHQKQSQDQKKIVVEIEYCSNCQLHLPKDRHSSLKFKSQFQKIKKKLGQHDIIVKKRSPPSYLIKKSPYTPLNLYFNVNTNCDEYFPRIGAFQIFFLNKCIHSSLTHKEWPNTYSLIIQIYKIALQNQIFQSYPFKIKPTKKLKKQNQEFLSSFAQNQQSPYLKNLVQSKKKYDQFRIKLQQKQVNSLYQVQRYGEIHRPNTTHIRQRQFIPKPHSTYRRQYYSRGHQKTNDQLFNQKVLQNSINIISQDKKSNKKNYNQNEEGSKQKYQSLDYGNLAKRKNRSRSKDNNQYGVYLQSLIPNRSLPKNSLQAQKQKLRKKIKDNLKKQQVIKKQAQILKNEMRKINSDNLQELLNFSSFD